MSEAIPPRGRPGRPRLSPEKRADSYAWAYMPAAEFEEVCRAAFRMGVSVSRFTRDAVTERAAAVLHKEKPGTV